MSTSSKSADGFPFDEGDDVLIRVREHGTSGNIVAKFTAECTSIMETTVTGTPVARFSLPWGSVESTKLRPYEAEFERVEE